VFAYKASVMGRMFSNEACDRVPPKALAVAQVLNIHRPIRTG